MRTIPAILLLALLSGSAAAAAPVALSVSYYGEAITHPGLSLGLDVGLVKAGPFRLVFAPEVGSYVHPRNHSALFVLPRLGARLISPEGFFGGLFVGAGWMHTWAPGVVYELDEAGEVQLAAETGRDRLGVSAGLGLGVDFLLPHRRPMAWFLRLEFLGETPVNTRFLPHFALQTGVRITLGRIDR